MYLYSALFVVPHTQGAQVLDLCSNSNCTNSRWSRCELLTIIVLTVRVRDSGTAWRDGCCDVLHRMPLLLTLAVSVAVGVGCETAAAWCSQICEDIGDSFECRCHAGYQLTDDGFTCVAADGKSRVLLLDRLSFSISVCLSVCLA